MGGLSRFVRSAARRGVGKLPAGARRLFPRPLRAPDRLTGGLWEGELRWLLSSPGCPACQAVRKGMNLYYFWFLEEQYYQPHTVEAMQAANGFCRRHARRMAATGARFRIAHVAQYLIAGGLARLAGAEAALAGPGRKGAAADGLGRAREILTPPGRCPACRTEAQDAERTVSLLVGYLDQDPGLRDLYAASSGLCARHFRAAAEIAPPPVLGFLAEQHRFRLAHRLKQLPEVSSAEGPLLEDGAPFAEALRAAVGMDLRPRGGDGDLPGLPADRRAVAATGEPSGKGSPRANGHLPWDEDPRFTSLFLRVRCPICATLARAQEEFRAWLAGQLRASPAGPTRRWDRFDAFCSEHAWMLLDAGEPIVAALISGDMLRGELEGTEALIEKLTALPPASLSDRLRAVPARLQAIWPVRWKGVPYLASEARKAVRVALNETPEVALDQALTTFRLRSECPICAHLERTTTRRLELLFALLEDASARTRYRDSWGLCVQHFTAAVRCAPDAERLRAMMEVQRARLAVLGWEVDEAQRLVNWSLRHEPIGAEKTAWFRAIERFVGPMPPTKGAAEETPDAGSQAG